MSPIRPLYEKLAGKSMTDILSNGPEFVRQRAVLRGIELYYRRTLHATRSLREAQRRAARDRLTGNDTILFLCHGNICRSPFAEQYASRRLEERGIDGVTIESAGLNASPERSSPADAQEAAADRGVNLAEHRAVQVDAEAVERADLVLVMDYRNYHDAIRRYLDSEDRIFFLRTFTDGKEMQVEDPYSEGHMAHTAAYDDIIDGVDSLLSAYS